MKEIRMTSAIMRIVEANTLQLVGDWWIVVEVYVYLLRQRQNGQSEGNSPIYFFLITRI